MDIGTAKPTEYERDEVTHHLLDILDPANSYSVASFRRDALQCVRDIQSRGHLPLLVGGTMMYFKALRDGLNEEDIVVSLFHDIGFISCPDSHGEFAAALLGNYVSERNRWMLRRHAIFQDVHCPHHPHADPQARERWRGHPNFEWAATFVERYDQAAIDPAYECAPLSHFEPMVMRLFSRPSQPLYID